MSLAEEQETTSEEIEEVEETEAIDGEETGDSEEAEPAWMQVDEEEEADQTAKETVPLAVLMKQKNKGKEKDAENERLQARVKELESAQPAQALPKRPRADDYDTISEHEDAMEVYDHQLLELSRQTATVKTTVKDNQARTVDAANAFFERADAIVAKHKIDPNVYKEASDNVQTLVEDAFPRMGDAAYPEFLSRLEDGDETTLMYIGRNKGQLLRLEQLFKEDRSGIKAFRHIARLTERNTGAKTKTSRAPKPAASVNGSGHAGTSSRQKKAYDKETDPQKRVNIKRAAKQAGLDVKGWR